MALYDPKEFPDFGASAGADQALIPSEPSRVSPSRPVGFDPSRIDAAEKLARSRELIELGWCQARMSDGHGSFCIYGALDVVLGGAPIFDIEAPIWRYLIAATGGDPIAFNDTPGRTQAEVVEAFRKAEALARGEA